MPENLAIAGYWWALAFAAELAYRRLRRALRLSVRTTAFHVVKTGSTPVGRATPCEQCNFYSDLKVSRARWLGHWNRRGMFADAEIQRRVSTRLVCVEHYLEYCSLPRC